jgi:hypothetical protein
MRREAFDGGKAWRECGSEGVTKERAIERQRRSAATSTPTYVMELKQGVRPPATLIAPALASIKTTVGKEG